MPTQAYQDFEAVRENRNEIEWVRSNRPTESVGTTKISIPVIPIVSTPPPLQLALELSKWDSRGWTYRERLLSRRCIYFSSQCVYFQCRSGKFCEVGEELPNAGESNVDPPSNPLLNIGEQHIQFPSVLAKKIYTKRQLTIPSDILAAFSGILGMLGLSIQGQILQGLPTNPLDLALLWNSTAHCKRRAQTSTTSGPAFPSRSWTGWDGSIWYRVVEQDEKTYPTSEISTFRILSGEKEYEVQKRTSEM